MSKCQSGDNIRSSLARQGISISNDQFCILGLYLTPSNEIPKQENVASLVVFTSSKVPMPKPYIPEENNPRE